jgi:hypothetical protein
VQERVGSMIRLHDTLDGVDGQERERDRDGGRTDMSARGTGIRRVLSRG